MTPEEIETLVNSLMKGIKQPESDYSPFYVILSLIVTSAVPLIRYIKKMFTKSIEKVVISHNEKIKEIVDNHFNQVSSLVNSYKDKLEDLFKIMHLHIDELGGLSKDVEKQEERIKKIEEKFK